MIFSNSVIKIQFRHQSIHTLQVHKLSKVRWLSDQRSLQPHMTAWAGAPGPKGWKKRIGSQRCPLTLTLLHVHTCTNTIKIKSVQVIFYLYKHKHYSRTYLLSADTYTKLKQKPSLRSNSHSSHGSSTLALYWLILSIQICLFLARCGDIYLSVVLEYGKLR